ncbi:hypothetical protein D3C85_1392360 [compost metagenome]
MVGIGIHPSHVFADQVHRLELTGFNIIEHPDVVFAGNRRDWNAIGFFKTLPRLVVRHMLVARQPRRQGTHVAGTLNIIVSAERISTGTWAHIIASCQQQVGNRG